MFSNNAYSEIIENLYIGSKNSLLFAGLFPLIVNCTKDIPFPSYVPNIIRIAVNDDPSESRNMARQMIETGVLEKIRESLEKKEKVLVHCFAGAQRSCAVVACYLIKYHQFSPERAIQYIRLHRPVAFFGGVNFMQVLQYFHQKIHY
jgi:hypothetical protein